MQIESSTFNEIPKDKLGVVIFGCDISTQENKDGFVNGITGYFAEQGVYPKDTTPDQAWENVFSTVTTGGRTDLIFVCKEGFEFNVGRWAMVRLQMGDCSWIEDWLVNYASHYGELPRGPHANLNNMFGQNNDADD